MAKYNSSLDILTVASIRATDITLGSKSTIDSDWVNNIVTESGVPANITALQTQVGTNTTNISTNTTNVASLQTRMTAAESKNTTQDTSITTLTNSLSTLNGTVSANSSSITNLQTSITNLSTNQSTLTTNQTSLQARVSSIENNDTVQDSAIDVIETDVASLKTFTGYGTSLTTTDSSANLADAVNEAFVDIGNVSTMTTTATDLAAAVNELKATNDTQATQITTLQNDVITLQGLVSDLIARVGGGSTPITLEDIDDVSVAGATTGQQLTYNGSGWSAANA